MSQFIGTMEALRPQFGASIHDVTWRTRAGGRAADSPRPWHAQFGIRQRQFSQLWPASGFLSGDRTPGYCLIGLDGNDCDQWSPWQRNNAGNGATKFLTGQCRDADNAIVGGAVVAAFRTSDNEPAGQSAADDQGNFEIGTVFAGVGHFITAYRAGSPDIAGTTRNDLVPTNRDGT